jgi:hypothetical protein
VDAQLRDRWRDIDAAVPTYRKVRFRRPSLPDFSLHDLAGRAPFGRVDDRVDLRGLPLGPCAVPDEELRDVDLSGARFDNVRLARPVWSDVLVAGGELTNCSFRGARLTRVTFRSTNLGGTALGIDGSTLADCELDRVKVPMTSFGRATLDGCRLRDLRGRAELDAAAFTRCAFVGLLDDVRFRNGWPSQTDEKTFGPAPENTMAGVDFSEATLSYVDFVNLDLSDVRLDPSRQVLCRAWERARLEFEDRAGPVGAISSPAFNAMAVLARGQRHCIVDLSFVGSEFGEAARADVQEVILRLADPDPTSDTTTDCG